MLLHSRLCEENGKTLVQESAKKDVAYITPACVEDKQNKLLKDEFNQLLGGSNGNRKPISISCKTTDLAFNDIQKALNEVG